MWSLKVIKGAELADQLVPEVRLPAPLTRFLIGRDPGNAWHIGDRTLAISARHCEIVATPHGPALRDLSTNGTFVNDAPARMDGDFVLRDGDRFELGPFLIAVSGPPMPPRPATVSPPAAALPPRTPGVMETAPRRGGDPAAMLAAGGYDKVGLTEILRVAAPAEDSGLDMTRIRLAQPGAAAPRAAAAPVPPPPVLPAGPTPTAATSPAALAEALARGLGVPVSSLPAQDPLHLAEQLAAAARASAVALRQLLDHQSMARRALGSRTPSAPGPEASPLRKAATAEAALLAAPSAALLLEQGAAEVRAHEERLVKAFATASKRLAQQVSPASLQAGVPDLPPPTPEQYWAAFEAVWENLGLAPGQPWVQGFAEAARLHLGAALDDLAAR
jgi:predicted component of type VI protein secretion system